MSALVSLGGWLLGSKAGRIGLVAALSLALVALLLWRASRGGAEAERARALEQTIDNLRRKAAIDDEVSRLDPAARRERLRQWSRG